MKWKIRLESEPCKKIAAFCKTRTGSSNFNLTPPVKGSPSPKYKHGCTWTGAPGDSSIVIGLGKVKPQGGWVHVSRAGYHGLMFKTSPAPGISPKGMYGKYCFSVKAPVSGKYYMSVVSYAPHVTEHNDAWFASDKGFELWKREDNRFYRQNAAPMEWLKGYQNFGTKGNGIAHHLKTIDFNGHRFIVPNVEKDKPFKVCMSGRSRKYEVFRIVLVKCSGDYCKGKIMDEDMIMSPPVSSCY